MEAFLGTILMFGGNFEPRGWAFCEGQLVPISQNTALFSILGATYGGDGQRNFALPDMQGKMPMHPGNGRGLGEQGGEEFVAAGDPGTPGVMVLPPYLCVNFIICLQGMYPSRD